MVQDGTSYSAAWFGANLLERIDEFVARLRRYVGTERSFQMYTHVALCLQQNSALGSLILLWAV